MILHQGHSTPGRLGESLKRRGFDLDCRRPSLGDPLPATLTDHAGVVVFGGPMCANDEFDWIRREIDWMAVPLREGRPILGLCLGAQLLARHLGARVFTFSDRRGEVGYCELNPAPEADRLCVAPFPRHVYQWHFDGFDLPHGARLLASAESDFPNQAFAFGPNAIGLQFHPEVTYSMMCRWTVLGAEKLERPGAQPRERHLEGWFRYDRAVAEWVDALLPAWLVSGAQEATAEASVARSAAALGQSAPYLVSAAAAAPQA
ncbi:MAG: glutamine amidotransferase [Bradyrhizobium sp.]|nr:MAG: glutamine amidotransferase [Bradyrhizobium sp.]